MSDNRSINRRRYHKSEKRYNAAILDHEHAWHPDFDEGGIRYVSCLCGATAEEDANGKISSLVEPKARRLSGHLGARQ